jgi:hypothetical protein
MSYQRKIIYGVVGLGIAGFLVAQVFPFGNFVWWLERNENPPVLQTIPWDSPETEHLVRTACFDCHSNETVWPWYSYIAPGSWLVLRDVNQGRDGMNFSEDDLTQIDMQHLEDHIYSNMPPPMYLILHPEASYSDEQKDAMIAGIRATLTNAGHDGHTMDMSDMDMGEGE